MEAFRQRGKSGRAAARTALGAALATDCATENVPRCGGGGGVLAAISDQRAGEHQKECLSGFPQKFSAA